MTTEFGTQAADVPPATLEFAHRMFDAACEGNPELLRAAIDALLPVNLTNNKGNMCLKLASYPNHPTLVSDLLVRRADPNRLNDPRQFPTAMGGAPLPDSHRLSIDTNPLYLTGMWSWMATELILAASGVQKPVQYKPHHDLESFFYVLLGISVLYDKPYKLKPEGELSECFDMCFNTSQPSFSRTITIQSQFGWSAKLLKHISPYFQPLIPLFEELRQKIVIPMTVAGGSFDSGDPITHDYMIQCLVDTLCKLPDWCWDAKSPPNSGRDGSSVDAGAIVKGYEEVVLVLSQGGANHS